VADFPECLTGISGANNTHRSGGMKMSTGGTLTTLEFSRLVRRIMQEREEKNDGITDCDG